MCLDSGAAKRLPSQDGSAICGPWESGRSPFRQAQQPKLVAPVVAKLEEWVERTRGAVRGGVIHQRLRALRYQGPVDREAGSGASQACVGTGAPPALPAVGARSGDVAGIAALSTTQ